MPTPRPARKIISSPSIIFMVVNIETPLVMSGSSPEFLMTSTRILLAEIFSTFAIGIFKIVPSSAVISTSSTIFLFVK